MWNDSKFGIRNQEDRDLAMEWRAHRQSSPALEAKLVAEFRVERQARKGNRYIWYALAAAAAVAIIGLSPALFHRQTPATPIAPILNTAESTPLNTAESTPRIVEPKVVVAEIPPQPKPRLTRKQPRPTPQPVDATLASRRESYTEFFAINSTFSRDQLDRGQVIRVQLPRSALFTIGMPVDVNRLDESIKADLVMGEDGIARAVRFVQ